jgi:hypothetical protein
MLNSQVPSNTYYFLKKKIKRACKKLLNNTTPWLVATFTVDP